MEILKIHSRPVSKSGEIDYEAIVKLTDGFNGADLRNVVTEAGMFAIRAERDAVIQEDFTKAARKVSEAKKHESTLKLFHICDTRCTDPFLKIAKMDFGTQ
jgi:26S proteasome regulatory subunit T4